MRDRNQRNERKWWSQKDHPEHIENKENILRSERYGVDQSKYKKLRGMGRCQTRRIRKKEIQVLGGRTEMPLIWIATVADSLKLGMAHEEVDPLHSGLLFLVVAMDVSESPVPLFVSAGSSDLIPSVRKGMEFRGSDVGTQ